MTTSLSRVFHANLWLGPYTAAGRLQAAVPHFLCLSLNFLFRAESANSAPVRWIARSRICSGLGRADFIQLVKE